MEASAFQEIQRMIIQAEQSFNEASRDARGIKAAARAIAKLEQISANRRQSGEDSQEIDSLIQASAEKLARGLSSFAPEASPNVATLDFNSWAAELVEASSVYDPLHLLFDIDDFSDDEHRTISALDTPGGPGTKASATPASIKIMKMTPKGKHREEAVQFLESSTEKQARLFSALSFGAWAFAVLCLLLVLGLLTSEFVQSQNNPAIQVEQVLSETVQLPAISICNNYEGLPSFENFPTSEYAGHPLFVVTTVSNEHDDDIQAVNYPDTVNSDIVEPIFRGSDPQKCERDTSRMSVMRSRNAMFRYVGKRNESVVGFPLDERPCLKCFRVGLKRRLELISSRERSPTQMPVAVNVAISRPYMACNLNYEKRSIPNVFWFSGIMQENLPDLEQKGIISFKNTSLSIAEKRLSFDRFQNADVTVLIMMACNVYFFSGHFYPSEDTGRIKWQWDDREATWKSIGEVELSYQVATANSDVFGEFTAASGRSDEVFTGRGVEVYYEDPNGADIRTDSRLIGSRAIHSFINGPSKSNIYFTKLETGKRDASFETDTDTTGLFESSLDPWRYMRLDFGFDYRVFASTHISSQATMSWPEFVTDVFEFIGLFTGVCIFSLIVAPARTLV